MIQLILSLLAMVLPGNFPVSPIVTSQFEVDAVVSVHADKSVSMVGVVESEKVLLCSVANPQSQSAGDPPVANLTTTWVDDSGSTQTVSTPIVSTTPAGLDRAIELHRDLVRRMKIIYPPPTP